MKENNPLVSIINFAKNNISDRLRNYILSPGEKYVRWGIDNHFPTQILDYYNNIPEHSSSIDFTKNCIIGDGLDNEIIIDYWVLDKIVLDYILFGCYSLQVIKKRDITKNYVKYVDVSKLRLSTTEGQILYSDMWFNYKKDYTTFNITDSLTKDGIFYYSKHTRDVYPLPNYFSNNLSLDTMYNISLFHNNNSKNGFVPNVIINYNGGNVSEEVMEETEKLVQEKYTGNNSQKFMLFFNDSKENSAEVIRLDSDNDDKKFESLQKFIQNQILVAHKIPSGQLIGIKPENQGFSKTEYQESLDIFKEVVINGLRKELEYSFKQLTGTDIKFKDKQQNNIVNNG